MNVTRPVLEATMIREPAVRSATAAAYTAKAAPAARDFAGALRHAELKPARRPIPAKTAAATNPDGGSLPPRGSASPPPAAPAPPPTVPLPPPTDAGESQAATSAATPGGAPGAAQPAQRKLSAGAAAAVVAPGPGRTAPDAPAARDAAPADDGVPATDFGAALGDPAASSAAAESPTAATPAAATPAAATLAAQGMKSLKTPAGAAAALALSGTEAATNDATLRAAPGTLPGDSTTTSTTAVTDAGFAAPPPPVLEVQATSAASVQTTCAAAAQALSGSGAAAIDADGGDKRARNGIRGKALDGIAGAGAGMAALGLAAASPAMTTPAGPPLKLSAAVGSPEFSQGLAERVTYLVDNNLNGAKLQVNPPQLGPIEVRIAVQGDHAQVWMSTHSLVTRDALESSSPKLREMLNAQGFGQVSVDISQRSFHDRSAYTAPPLAARAEPAAAASIASTTAPVSHITARSSAALDAYA